MKSAKEFMEYIEYNNFEWTKKYRSIFKYSKYLENILDSERVIMCFIGEAKRSKNLWDCLFDQTALYAITNRNICCVYPTYPGQYYFKIPIDRIYDIIEKNSFDISSLQFKNTGSNFPIYIKSSAYAIQRAREALYTAIDMLNIKEKYEDDNVTYNTIPIISSNFMNDDGPENDDLIETLETKKNVPNLNEKEADDNVVIPIYNDFEPVDANDFEELEKLEQPINYEDYYSNYAPIYDDDEIIPYYEEEQIEPCYEDDKETKPFYDDNIKDEVKPVYDDEEKK